MTDEQPAQRRKGRSPNYPGVDLKFAVERAAKLWDLQQQHPVASELAIQHLGYTPKSGAGSVTFGALKRFGLLTTLDDGRVRLSELALTIIRAERSGHPNLDRVREAALLPPVHQEMWEQYGADLPADSTLVFDLANGKGFTTGGAQDFVRQWKRTMAYAKLAEITARLTEDDGRGDTPEVDEDASVTSSAPASAPPAPTQPSPAAASVPSAPAPGSTSPEVSTAVATSALRVPLLGGQWATLQAPIPMTEEAWDHFITVLQALKPAATTRPGDA